MTAKRSLFVILSFFAVASFALRSHHANLFRTDHSSSSFTTKHNNNNNRMRSSNNNNNHRTVFENDNLLVDSPGVCSLGSEQRVSCTLPEGQQVLACVMVTPFGGVWTVRADGSVVDENNNVVAGYVGVLGEDRTCGLRILSVGQSDMGDWSCQVDRSNGATLLVRGFANLREELNVDNVRLPGNIVPLHYDVRIIPLIPEKVIHGEFSIDVEVTGPSTSELTVHILTLSLLEETVRLTTDEGTTEIPIVSHGYDFDREFYRVGFLPPGGAAPTYTLRISGRYTASLLGLPSGENGLYHDSYVDSSSVTHELAVTQLQPTNARNAFPCLDEPALKATFTVSLAHTADHPATLSNMPVAVRDVPVGPEYPGYLWDEFETTVRMSTYLVAMAVSDLRELPCETLANGVETSVWARPEAVQQGLADWPCSYAPENLRYYEELFGIPFPLPKVDHFVPPSRGGAMENWGLITYGEVFILYDPVNGGPADKELATSVVTHELVHQWFGNLVTLSWWNGIWLNEGFATYTSYFGAEHVTPEMRHWDRFTVDEMHGAMELDSSPDSHPVNFDISNPVEIDEAFDRISYDKGGSLLRMLTGFLTEGTFLKGVNRYLTDLQFSDAEQADLWGHLNDAGHEDGTLDADKDVATIMAAWTDVMNYPLLTVDVSGTLATLTQSRFVVADDLEDDPQYRWWIPISFTHTADFSVAAGTRLFLSPDDASLTVPLGDDFDGSSPVIFNLQQTAFLRVNYDSTNWARIVGLLQTDHGRVHLLNRAQILDDSFALADAGILPYDTPLSLTRYLDQETDYVPFFAANVHLRDVESRMRFFQEGITAYRSYVQSKVGPMTSFLGIDESEVSFTFMENLMRLDLLPMACLVDSPECLDAAGQRMSEWVGTGAGSPSPFGIRMRPDLYCAAVKADVTAWDFVLSEVSSSVSSSSERQALVQALSCPEDQTVLENLLSLLLDESSSVYPDVVSTSGRVAGNVVGRTLIWSWLETNWDVLQSMRDQVVSEVARVFSLYAAEQEDVDLLRAFLQGHTGEMGAAAVGALEEAVVRVEENLEWHGMYYEGVVSWLQGERV